MLTLLMALLHRVIQKIRQSSCLIIVIAPGWPEMPWFWDLVQLSTEIPLQLPVSRTVLKQSHIYVSQQSITSQPPRLLSKSGHLTLKTVFLLALASGKRRSEIHAWIANKVSNLGQWEKVALFPSSDFIAKNQLARELSQSVSPVTLLALTTIVDRQFKEDRTLCQVGALRYYLD